MLTNPGTGFDEDGWADALSDLRRLFLLVEGGSNDLNAGAVSADQDTANSSSALTREEVQAMIDASIDTPVFFAGHNNQSLTSQTLSAGYNDVTVDTLIIDTHNAWNSNIFNVPLSGYYRVTFSGTYVDFAATISNQAQFEIWVNGALGQLGDRQYSWHIITAGALQCGRAFCLDAVVALNAGDSVKLRVNAGTANDLLSHTRITIVKQRVT